MEKKNYQDIPLMPAIEGKVVCPECDGHGKWNLRVDAYGKGIHFQASCCACWGWGYINAGACPHSWDGVPTKEDRENVRAEGSCGSLWKCSKCNHVIWVDSSD